MQPLFPVLSLVWPLDGSTTTLTGTLPPGRRASQEGELQQGPALAGKGGFQTGLGLAGLLAAWLEPVLVLSP